LAVTVAATKGDIDLARRRVEGERAALALVKGVESGNGNRERGEL
jgi:hypothetical protein